MAKTKKYKVHRRGGSYSSRKAPRRKGQKYYPNRHQASANRHASAKAAARARKKRGTQWRHGRKSKREVRRHRRS